MREALVGETALLDQTNPGHASKSALVRVV